MSGIINYKLSLKIWTYTQVQIGLVWICFKNQI